MTIIITGASRGIGFELVKAFISDPTNLVFAISRSIEYTKKLARAGELPKNLVPIAMDLREEKTIEKLIPEIRNYTDRVDILINNAGAVLRKKMEVCTPEEFDHLFSINVKAPFFLMQALLPLFHSGTHIVNISSMGGFQGSAKFGGLALYSASKGALSILTEALAEEWKKQGICVNCLALGAVQTEMLAEAFPGYQAPMKPSEMASFIHDFAIHAHRYINGKVIPVSLSTP
ncbi:MAG: SDR family oxidoreductase [Bacteroidetes bacterium]|nr:SDR family oxidoreductase [Bacteroidota bacterium]